MRDQVCKRSNEMDAAEEEQWAMIDDERVGRLAAKKDDFLLEPGCKQFA